MANLELITMLNSAMFSAKLLKMLKDTGKQTFTLEEIKSTCADATMALGEEIRSAEEQNKQEKAESDITEKFGKTGLA